MHDNKFQIKIFAALVLTCFIVAFNVLSFTAMIANAQSSTPVPTIPADSENINSSSFRLLICDGPPLPTADMVAARTAVIGHTYVPCDFNGAMMQVQHIINIAIIAGVLVAIFGFSYAGFLYIRGREADRTQASSMFQKIFIGFIIMLSAWFIVYQLLSWLTGNSAFNTLLGPK